MADELFDEAFNKETHAIILYSYFYFAVNSNKTVINGFQQNSIKRNRDFCSLQYIRINRYIYIYIKQESIHEVEYSLLRELLLQMSHAFIRNIHKKNRFYFTMPYSKSCFNSSATEMRLFYLLFNRIFDTTTTASAL